MLATYSLAAARALHCCSVPSGLAVCSLLPIRQFKLSAQSSSKEHLNADHTDSKVALVQKDPHAHLEESDLPKTCTAFAAADMRWICNPGIVTSDQW